MSDFVDYSSLIYFVCCFFFFKQKTAYEMRISDWSSDVCSSDLEIELREVDRAHHQRRKAAFPGVVGEDSAGEGEQMARHLDHHQTLAHLLADVRRDAHHRRIVQFHHEGRGLADLG